MSEVSCSRIKLKPDSLPRVREWVRVMADRRDEALATLDAEGVFEEIVFLEHSEEGDCLAIFMRAEDMARAREVGRTSEAAIDAYHKQFKRDAIEGGLDLEPLVDLNRLSRGQAGSQTVKVDPSPNALSTSIRPPCSWTMLRLT